jgi:zinc protease
MKRLSVGTTWLMALGLAGCAFGMSTGEGADRSRNVNVGPGQGDRAQQPRFDRSTPPPVGPAEGIDIPTPEEFTLENGLRVLVVSRPEVPLVSLSLQMPGGARVLDPDQAGLASLVADLLDEGTEVRTAFELADEVDLLGASLRSSSGYDANTLSLQVLSSRLDEGLDLFAEVLLRPSFPEEELERLRNERLTEILQSRDEVRVLASQAFARVLYGDQHPYGQPLGGTQETVAGFTRDDVMAYYRARYQPAGAILLAVGDLEAETFRERVEDLLGDWQAMMALTPAFDIPGGPSGTTVYIVDKPGAAQSEIRVGRVGINAADPDFITLNVMNTVLGGSFTSRLNTRLREEKGYSYGAGSGFDRRQLPGPFVASSAVYTPVTDSAVVEFVREIGRMSEERVPRDELERARNYVALRLPQSFETNRDLTSQLGFLYLYDLPPTYYDTFVSRTMEVDAGEVQDAARRWLSLEDMVIVVAGDRETIEEPLRALGIGPVVVLPVPGPEGVGGP